MKEAAAWSAPDQLQFGSYVLFRCCIKHTRYPAYGTKIAACGIPDSLLSYEAAVRECEEGMGFHEGAREVTRQALSLPPGNSLPTHSLACCTAAWSVRKERGSSKTMSVAAGDKPAAAAVDTDRRPEVSPPEEWAISTGFKCIVCNDTKKDWRSLWRHMETHNPSPDDSQVTKDSSTGLLQCLICGHQTGVRRNMHRHFSAHTTWRPFQCIKCRTTCKSTYTLLQHLKEAHEEGGSTVYKCQQCDYSSDRRRSMMIHKHTMHSGRGRCEVCFRTIRAGGLLEHYYVHTREERFSCNVCGEKFVFKRVLRRHIENTHLNLTHDCKVCGKKFTSSGHLLSHMRKHTDEPSHTCCICSKPFYNQAQYVKHVAKVHTGERNEKCVVCGKGFFSKVQLQNHLVVHTGEKPFSCDVCGKAFPFKYKIKDHMKTHSEERPFKCDRCGEAFKWKHNLASHVRARHT